MIKFPVSLFHPWFHRVSSIPNLSVEQIIHVYNVRPQNALNYPKLKKHVGQNRPREIFLTDVGSIH
jgi:hypothetical protein